ncbi:MAG: hypothetical protein FWG10_13715 [Eubacteriaceae bacterium]|nr:hypothetical protein [Eubacteriaceae bacterium]
MKRKTAAKKLRTKLSEMNQWLKRNRLMRVKGIVAMINLKLRGHYQYYGITDNADSIDQFKFETQKLLFKWLNRRSQKRSYTWEEFNMLLRIFPLAHPRLYFSVFDWHESNLLVRSRVRELRLHGSVEGDRRRRRFLLYQKNNSSPYPIISCMGRNGASQSRNQKKECVSLKNKTDFLLLDINQ